MKKWHRSALLCHCHCAVCRGGLGAGEKGNQSIFVRVAEPRTCPQARKQTAPRKRAFACESGRENPGDTDAKPDAELGARTSRRTRDGDSHNLK